MNKICLSVFSVICLAASASAQAPDTSKKLLPPGAKIEVTTTTVSAEDVIKKYITAIGGEDALKKIKDVTIVRSAVVQEVPITITEVRKTPDKLKIMIEGMDMVFQKVVVNKDKGYQENRGQKTPLSTPEVSGTLAEADLLGKLYPEKYGIRRQFKGVEIVDSLNTYVLEETDPIGKVSNQYYDVFTGLLVRKSSTENTPSGPVPTITSYRNYKEVPGSGGYKIPEIVKQEVGPQVVISTLKNVEVNKTIQDKEFE